MKNVSLLVWMTQLGLSVAVTPVMIVLLAVYLRSILGGWIIWVGAALAVWLAVTGFVSSLRMLQQLSADEKKEAPPVAFNDHE